MMVHFRADEPMDNHAVKNRATVADMQEKLVRSLR